MRFHVMVLDYFIIQNYIYIKVHTRLLAMLVRKTLQMVLTVYLQNSLLLRSIRVNLYTKLLSTSRFEMHRIMLSYVRTQQIVPFQGRTMFKYL